MNRSAGSSTGDRRRDQRLERDHDMAKLGNLPRRTRVDICEGVVGGLFQEVIVALLGEKEGAAVVRYRSVI